jgi:hypothetical protein
MVESLLNVTPLLIQDGEFTILHTYLAEDDVDKTFLQFVTAPVEHAYLNQVTNVTEQRKVSNRRNYWTITRYYDDGMVPEAALELINDNEQINDGYIIRKLVDGGKLSWFNKEQREEAYRLYVNQVLVPLDARARTIGRPLVRVNPHMVDGSLTGNPVMVGIFLRDESIPSTRNENGWLEYGTAVVAYPILGQMHYINKPIEALDVFNIEDVILNPILLADQQHGLLAESLMSYLDNKGY